MREFWSNWNVWNAAIEPPPSSPRSYKKISLCVACSGQTSELKQTLLQNVSDNADYPNIEFVVLNYNSGDDMHFFMQTSKIKNLLRNGRVKYYITKNALVENLCHARNVAMKCASGHIIVNVNPNVFVGNGFAQMINALSEVPCSKPLFLSGKVARHGLLGIKAKDFLEIGGYDEGLRGSAFCDQDLVLRCMNSGFKLFPWMSFYDSPARPSVSSNRQAGSETPLFIGNRSKSITNISAKKFVANAGQQWGHAQDLQLFRP
jgi:hypothetical protein